MRFKNRLPAFLLMVALAGQGIVPGLVLCRGEEGHAAVEIAFDQCCSSVLQSSVQAGTAASLKAAAPPLQDGCGFCSDTPIPTNPSLPPSPERSTIPDQAGGTAIAAGNVPGFVNMMAHACVTLLPNPLIHITTTVLLI